jgi:hypothetical protein
MEDKVYTQDELRALFAFADGRKIMATAERRNCNGNVLDQLRIVNKKVMRKLQETSKKGYKNRAPRLWNFKILCFGLIFCLSSHF